MKLNRNYVEKPWGRSRLPPMFDAPVGQKIGEVWFTATRELPLLAKYIFTGERLSIQVHPNDRQARQHGFAQGKSECWYILDSDPGATLGLGLKHAVSSDELRDAALNGSIEELVNWRTVAPGDFFFVPAGTIHAIGAGISLLEFQQNVDVTYRLYDYGRPRELHLDHGIAVANPGIYPDELARHVSDNDDQTLVAGPHFALLHSHEDRFQDRQRWVMPLAGLVEAGSDTGGPGDCLLVPAGEAVTGPARMLIGVAV